jgi:hypothetical protein
MQLDPNPSFRRVIPPWYDTDALCYAVILLMLIVLVFSMAGVSVAWETPEFFGHVWLPALLSVLSLSVLISTLLRLLRRHRRTSG